MKTVYLALGANVGGREHNLQAAIDALHRGDLRITRISPVYETEPMGLRNQPWFLNLVVEAHTTLFPRQLLKRLHTIEKDLGRQRHVVNGPRTIDIDILFYGGFTIGTPELTVPHPRLHERRFVLQPLADLAPELRHPGSRKTVKELLASLSGQAAKRVEFQPRRPANEP
jgi:2-amino-4-hydroxy-6-hydroxymethyldihydropteridine diphosphokinase